MKILYLAFGLLLVFANPAEAAPVAAFIAGAVTTFKGSAFFAFLTTNAFGKLLTSMALSALAQALAPRPRPPGIQTDVTQTGGTNPQSFILGRYATSGFAVCPPMSHGQSGKTRNAFLTYVIDVGDVPGVQLLRVIINDQYVELGTTPHPEYGFPALGKYAGVAWVKYYDGTQTAADPMLVARYGNYPQRPWSEQMIGRGVPYAIFTFQFARDRWQGLPSVRFELGGVPLYDPRLDSTVGGVGAHRWDNPATWAPSNNPVVQVYNISRGIPLQDGSTWGGGYAVTDLPLANWFAAMNQCDVPVALPEGGTEPQYRAGFEITVDQEPAAVMEELLKSCAGQPADIGGVLKVRVGGPGLPVYSFTDADVVINAPQELDPFPGLQNSYNAIHAMHPEPESLWEAKDAPPRRNATWEAEDGGRRLTASLSLPSVPYAAQVQRLMRAFIEEERRFRRHVLTLPPDAAILEPLDATPWTSARNGYTAKVFEVAEVADDLMTGLQRVTLRERDAGDWAWTPSMQLPVLQASPVPVDPAPLVVPGWSVAAVTIADGAGAPRRPAIRMSWAADQMEEIEGLAWEIRLAGGATILRGTTQAVAAGSVTIAEGILPSTAYEARGQVISEGPKDWTPWTFSPATDALRFGTADLAPESVTGVQLAPAAVTADKFNTANLAVAGVSIFGGELRSSNYVPGVDGWVTRHDGSAEFNTLTVREDMIVQGAVSRRGFRATDTAAPLVTATQTALFGLNGVNGFQPRPILDFGGGNPANPVVADVVVEWQVNSTESCTIELTIWGERIADGVWVELTTVANRRRFGVPTGFNAIPQNAFGRFFIGAVGNDLAAIYGRYTARAQIVAGTATSATALKTNMLMEQVNR